MRARKGPGVRRYGLDLAQCWTKAKRRMREASGINPDEASRIAEPISRARRLAELAAPADMRASLALTLGATAEELEADKAGARLILEGAHKRLGIVGLRSGESLEESLSERMAGFLRAWFEPTPPPPTPPAAALEPEAATQRALTAAPVPEDGRDRNRP